VSEQVRPTRCPAGHALSWQGEHAATCAGYQPRLGFAFWWRLEPSGVLALCGRFGEALAQQGLEDGERVDSK
jgi:hypothetical protein